jgi:hypothetical protein
MKRSTGTNPEQPTSAEQPEARSKRAKRHNQVQKLIDVLNTAGTTEKAIAEMGLRPSHMRRLLSSRAFRGWIAMHRQLTKVLAARCASEKFYTIMSSVYTLSDGKSETAAMRACMFYLNAAMRDPFAREGGRAGRTPLEALTLELLSQNSLPPCSPPRDANHAPRQITAAPTGGQA